MAIYQFRLDVPDDFDPEELSIELDYDGQITILDEGFVDVDKIAKQLVDSAKLDKLEVAETSVVVFKFPSSIAEVAPNFVQAIQNSLEAMLGCTVIGLVDDMDLLVQNSAEAIKMLEGMIAKIKSKSLIKLA